MCDQNNAIDKASPDEECSVDFINNNDDPNFGASIFEAVEGTRTPEKHDEAFIDGRWDQLSPIKNSSQVLQETEAKISVASTPFEGNVRPQNLKRSVKRRRRSRFSEQKPKQKRKFDLITTEKKAVEPESKMEEPKMECSITGESIDEILSAERTIIPNSLPSSPIDGNSISMNKSESMFIQITDSLQISTEMHSKLTTTFDDIIMSDDINLSADIVCNKEEKAKNDKEIDPNYFYGLPAKSKEVLKEHRGITNLYGKFFFHALGF